MRAAMRCLLGITAASSSLAAVSPGASSVAGTGGRVTLVVPQRETDGRTNPSLELVLTSGEILQVALFSGAVVGTATMHTCGTAVPASPVTFTFSPHEVVYQRLVTPNGVLSCLTATSPVGFVVDRVGAVSATGSSSGLQYVPLSSPRVLLDADSGPQGGELRLPLGIVVPPEARGTVFLVESLAPDVAGYAVGHDCSAQRSLSYDVAYTNSRAAGIVYADLSSGMTDQCLYASAPTILRVTLFGWLSTSGPDTQALPPGLGYASGAIRPPGLRAVTPVRVLDTRTGLGVHAAGPLLAGSTSELALGGNVAGSTTAVVLNVTVDNPAGPGYVTLYPCDHPRPSASNLNFSGGQTVPNLVTVKLAITGAICIYTSTTTGLLADLAGTFETNGGAGVQPVTPDRLLDTRAPIGVLTIGKVQAGQTLTLEIAGRSGVPLTGLDAVTMNVTVDQPDAPGYLTVYPCDRPRPTASNLNYSAGQTVPNLVTVKLAASGTVCLYTVASAHLVADLAAWYRPQQPSGYKELTPDRLLDTRQPLGVPTVGKISNGQTLTLQVAGRSGVPSTGVDAVTMNVTVDQPDGPGYLTVYPCDQPRPTASNLNYAPGQTIPNLVTAKLALNGTICLYTVAAAHLVADIAGYLTSTADNGWVKQIG